ncbi:MAG: FAD-dependent oxidoreductase, partial [Myxococcaceae bacterium]|nr:FAD-dependent oxidoreductase [Myxococcaceae bacterium]
MKHVIVIGGGVGGLSAAISLAQQGVQVTLCEAKGVVGGLAAPLVAEGVRFDAGPYVLLDPDGLQHAFTALGLDLGVLELQKVESVYEVESPLGPPVRIEANLAATVQWMERDHPGQGVKYQAFVEKVTRIHRALAPLQREGRPSAWSLFKHGAFFQAPFLLRPLGQELERAGFSAPLRDAVGIWTHIAGQRLDEAPSPLALVPAMIHGPGCFVPRHGVSAVAEVVAERALALGVTVHTESAVRRILSSEGRVTGVELEWGDVLSADAVVSGASGVATLLELADTPSPVKAEVAALPLQSPGVAAYLLAERPPSSGEPYLRFGLKPSDATAPCRLLVRPSVLPMAKRGKVAPTRVVAPLSHAVAQQLGAPGQHQLLDSVLRERWVNSRVGP